MNPADIITWAIFIALAWIIFASMTGADEWLKSLIGTSKISALERKIEMLESRINDLESKKEKQV